jgi:acyl-coenzyme A synthetase/AMP-(fatty) acid ligase
MPQNDEGSVWESLNRSGDLSNRFLFAPAADVSLGDLRYRSSLGGALEMLRGRCVLLVTRDQLAAALALIELDGVARRVVLCTPDLSVEHLPLIARGAQADAVVSEDPELKARCAEFGAFFRCSHELARIETGRARQPGPATEWVLLTSGTTGPPKMVAHTLRTLCGAIRTGANADRAVVWSTFYDIRRYGGLQILLRALFDGASLVLSGAQESPEDFLKRAGARGVTHISGTPSHWRRALMSPAARAIAPRYVRLSGEIADQAILDTLRNYYNGAKIVHAFATTEAGVAFEVADGLAGFPSDLITDRSRGVELKIQEGSLRVRSPRAALRYLGTDNGAIACSDGFVDTRDMVERRGERYYFAGRKDGIINVGGLKVHPEEVESVINRHPNVRMSLVRARRSPITGAVVVADVVLNSESFSRDQSASLKSEILDACHRELAAHKIPATVRFVPALAFAASGKLARV